MGSNTLASFPEGKPLKNRTNLVLFPGGAAREDCLVVQSLEELFAEIKKYPAEDVFVVGGAMAVQDAAAVLRGRYCHKGGCGRRRGGLF